MKQIICVILSTLLVVVIAAGCYPTPESPIVVGKDVDIMLDKAQAIDPQTESGAAVDLYERLHAPQTYTAELVRTRDLVSVHVDASIELPDCELPIYRIKAATFTTEQVQRFAAALFGDDAHYIENEEVKTKAVYQREIEKLRRALDDWDNVGTYMFDMVYDTREDAERALAERLAEADAAPEELPDSTPDFQWIGQNAATNAGAVATTDAYMRLYAMPDPGTISRLDVNNSRDMAGTADLYYWRDVAAMLGAVSTKSADVTESLHIAEQDALAIAQDTVARMQLSGFVCSAKQQSVYRLDPSGRTNKAVYDFMFTRELDGVVETYTNDDACSSAYAKPWQYEKIHVLVDDEGVLEVRYLGPCEIVEKVMPATTLKPFGEIREIFERMVLLLDNHVDTDTRGRTEQYVITSVRLGLMSIQEKDAETGLLIPVWDFLGYLEAQDANSAVSRIHTNELESFLTINGIDGSIVERGNGS